MAVRLGAVKLFSGVRPGVTIKNCGTALNRVVFDSIVNVSRTESATGTALDLLRATWRAIEIVAIFSCVAALVILNVPGFDSMLNGIGLNSVEIQADLIVPVILLAILLRLIDLKQDSRPSDERLVFRSAVQLYPLLEKRMALIDRDSEKKLEVLGINLKTAWPSINQLVGTGCLDGWDLSFAAFVSDVPALSESCPPDWSHAAVANLRQLKKAAGNQDYSVRRIKLHGFRYTHSPAVHGFRLGNGDLFISTLRWSDDGTHLTLRSYAYEFVPAQERSESASVSRALFETWWKSCTRPGDEE